MFYNDDCSPARCRHCGSDKIHQVNTDWIEGTLCEYQAWCSQCGEMIGAWAYGSWDPSFLEEDSSYRRKMEKSLFQSLQGGSIVLMTIDEELYLGFAKSTSEIKYYDDGEEVEMAIPRDAEIGYMDLWYSFEKDSRKVEICP